MISRIIGWDGLQNYRLEQFAEIGWDGLQNYRLGGFAEKG